MLVLDEHVITSSIFDIINELKSQLFIRGIERFKDIKIGPQDLAVTCPIHKNGQENSPSCGITLVEKGKIVSGTVHCFTCGYRASLPEMISNVFGYDDKGLFGKRWLLSNFLALEIDNRKDFIKFDLIAETNNDSYISEQELSTYRYYHEYMFQRRLTKEIIIKFDIGFDKNTNCITFPVYDENGNCLFIARRSVIGKFFNYPKDVDKPLYGLHLIPANCKSVIICESMFNALTCWVYGKPSIALLGTGSDSQIKKLKELPFRHYVLALDPDEAGNKGCTRLKKGLNNKSLSKLCIPLGKDVNDLNEEEFLNLQEYLY